MTAPANQNEQFGELVAGYANGLLTGDELSALEQQLAADAQAKEQFVLYMDIHARLQWNNRAEAAAEILGAEEQTTDSGQLPVINIEANPASLSRRKKRFDSIHWKLHKIRFNAMTAVLTALGWIGFSYFVWFSTTPDDSRPKRDGVNVNFVAHITGQYEHRWAESMPGMPPNAFLVPGERLNLVEGLIEITFYDGAKVVLEAPAEFVVGSRGAGILNKGRLTARVPQRAIGFVIGTPSAEIIDLGTSFGVSVDSEGLTDVTVITGLVEVSHGSSPRPIRLEAGQALEIGPTGASPVRNSVDAGRFVVALPQPPLCAQLTAIDTTTGGEWVGTYGSDGYKLFSNSGIGLHAESLPTYVASVTQAGGDYFQWDGSVHLEDLDIPVGTTYSAVLEDADQNTQRAAGTYFTEETATVTIKLNHAQTFQVAVYHHDYDNNNARSQSITVTDLYGSSTTSTLSNFSSPGVWTVYTVRGDAANPVSIEVTYTGIPSLNATISGITFSAAPVE